MGRILDVQCEGTHPRPCACPPDLAIGVGDTCVLDLDRVPEYGRVVALRADQDPVPDSMPRILRRATMQDQTRAAENQLFAKSAWRLCQEKIRHHRLEMRLVRVHYALDRSRLTVAFIAERRVDFRQFIQDLAADTRSRVEMRQIGAREAAAIRGGLAPCGCVLCCAVWLRELDNIHIRMAKEQGLSLNPATINGMCGRLKCCLRYEHAGYQNLAAGLPYEGARVRCPGGEGVVLDTRLLLRRVRVRLDGQGVVEYPASDVFVLGKPGETAHNARP